MLHAHDLYVLGLPGWAYEIVGVSIFFGSFVAVLYRMHGHFSNPASMRVLSPTMNRRTGAPIVPLPAVSGATPSIASPRTDASGRIFVGGNTTPVSLSEFFKNHTSMEANRFIEPYLGKWIDISGKIREIAEYSDDTIIIYLDIESSSTLLVSGEFGVSWKDKIAIMRKGDQVEIRGSIKRVSSGIFSMVNCEVLE